MTSCSKNVSIATHKLGLGGLIGGGFKLNVQSSLQGYSGSSNFDYFSIIVFKAGTF